MATKKDSGTKSNGNKKPVTQTQSEMQTTEIRDLIDFIAQSGLNEVDIETKELKLHVKREPDQRVMKSTPVAVVAQPQQQVVAQQQVAQQVVTKTEKAVATAVKGLEIKSPMIGTFYRTSNPDSPPFISVGDKVTKGQTVCIIEAMKLFNEIESEVSGTIVKVMVENASPVEYDQVLFVVEPE
jgi:acetyl-CoA carboxylase biotin carboxyl carrier protein